jgi:hypothetical protein
MPSSVSAAVDIRRKDGLYFGHPDHHSEALTPQLRAN